MKTVSTSKMSSLRRANCIEGLESRIVFDGAIDVEPHADASTSVTDTAHDDASKAASTLVVDEVLQDGTHHMGWAVEGGQYQYNDTYDYYWHTDGTQNLKYDGYIWQADGNGWHFETEGSKANDSAEVVTGNWEFTNVDLDSSTSGSEFYGRGVGNGTAASIYHGYEWDTASGLGSEYAVNLDHQEYYEVVYREEGVGVGHRVANYTGYDDYTFTFDNGTPTFLHASGTGTDWTDTCWTGYWSYNYNFEGGNGNPWSVDPVVTNTHTPTSIDHTVVATEDSQYIFATTDFDFSDGDTGDTLHSIQITQLETAGALKLNGVDVSLNQEISVAEIDAGKLTFDSVANTNGAEYSNFQFRVSDGTTYSTAPYELMIHFAPVVNSWLQSAHFFDPDGMNSDDHQTYSFGFSVSISGNYAIVGVPSHDVGETWDQGLAYIYELKGEKWVYMDKLTAPDGAHHDWFGYSVSINGNHAIVGAIGRELTLEEATDSLFTDSGAAYIYELKGEKWVYMDKLTAPDLEEESCFGCSVSIDGNYAIVGEFGDTIGENAWQGAAYIYELKGENWVYMDKLTAPDGDYDDNFGSSVSINGDYAVVGVPYDDVGENSDQGSAYIFELSGGSWIYKDKLTAPDGGAGDFSGSSVSIDNNFAVVGGHGYTYIFELSGGSWIYTDTLTLSDTADNDWLGSEVSISGNYIVNSAYGLSGGDLGSAYIYELSGGRWVYKDKLTASDGELEDGFGYSVSISGNYVVVGVPHDDVGENLDQGSAYIYSLGL